ncbi:MAG: hypothetical protein ABIG95_03360, partial [Candidatus Woesearchaeota archaeon]
ITQIFSISILILICAALLFKSKNEAYNKVNLLTIASIFIAIFSAIVLSSEGVPYWLKIAINMKVGVILQQVLLMFRTLRFVNLALLIFIPTFFTIFFSNLVNEVRNNCKLKLLIYAIMILAGFLAFYSGLTWLSNGNGPANYGGVTFEMSNRSLDYSSLMHTLLTNVTDMGNIIAVHQWAGGVPNIYMTHGIEAANKQFLVRYIFDSNYGEFFREAKLEQLSYFLSLFNVRYFIVDTEKISDISKSEKILTTLNVSNRFTLMGKSGGLFLYQVKTTESQNYSLVYYFGGMESFRKSLEMWNKTTTMIPIFGDSGTDISKFEKYPYDIILSDYTSDVELAVTELIHGNESIVITSKNFEFSNTQYQKEWVPGYIYENIGGIYLYILPHLPNYRWQFPYSSTNAFIYTVGSDGSVNGTFVNPSSDSEKKYRLFIRVLRSPTAGTFQIMINGLINKTINAESDSLISYYEWQDLGNYQLRDNSYGITVKNVKGVNAFNNLVLVPDVIYRKKLAIIQNIFIDHDLYLQLDGAPEPQESFYSNLTRKKIYFPKYKQLIQEYIGFEEINKSISVTSSKYRIANTDNAFCIVPQDNTNRNQWSWTRFNKMRLGEGNYSLVISINNKDLKNSHLLIEDIEFKKRVFVYDIPAIKSNRKVILNFNLSSISNIQLIMNSGMRRVPDNFSELCIDSIHLYRNIVAETPLIELKKGGTTHQLKILQIGLKYENKLPIEYNFRAEGVGTGILPTPMINDGLWTLSYNQNITGDVFTYLNVLTAAIIKSDTPINTTCKLYNPKNMFIARLELIYLGMMFIFVITVSILHRNRKI